MLEDGLRIEDVVYFRVLGDAEVAQEEAVAEASLKEQRKSESMLVGWVKGAVRSVTGVRPMLQLLEGEQLLSEADKRALHEATAYEETIAQATVPDHFPIMSLAVSLNEGTISYVETSTRPIARVIVDTTATFVMRPHSWTLDMALGALEVFDLDPQTEYRTVVTRKARSRPSNTQASARAPLPEAMMKVSARNCRESPSAVVQAWSPPRHLSPLSFTDP